MAAILSAAALAGVLAVAIRLPPMVGFLAVGFVLNATGVAAPAALDTVAGLGVTLLLFAIGLKFDLSTLLRREVLLAGVAQLVACTAAATLLLAALALTGLSLLRGLDVTALATLGLAISFSSTVLVVKLLEDRGLEESLVGRTAIGILVLQDLVAVALITLVHGRLPSAWALLLVPMLPAVALLARLAHPRVPRELLPLVGVTLAFVAGYAAFDAVGLKGDLGALVVGIAVGTQPGAHHIARSLLGPKDLLLVGFFLSIGFAGIPGPAELAVAVALLLLVPLKTAVFALAMRHCGFRRRTAALGGTLLGNHSEFALIAAVALSGLGVGDRWVTTLATSVALSMVLSTLVVRRGDRGVELIGRLLPRRDPAVLHPEDRPLDVGDAEAVVLGMGRVGRAAYDRLAGKHGMQVVGVELDGERVAALRSEGREVLQGDATDPEFWSRIAATISVRVAVLAMPFHGNNLEAQARLLAGGFAGTVAVVAQRDEDLEQALRHGAATGVQLYEGAGAELADRAIDAAGGPAS